jgi:hypothetical protein
MVDLKMTRFKVMSMDEHATMIKRSAQEAHRAKEEIRVTEETYVHNRGLSLTPDAQESGWILME